MLRVRPQSRGLFWNSGGDATAIHTTSVPEAPMSFDPMRRNFLQATAATGGAIASGQVLPASAAPSQGAASSSAAIPQYEVRLRVNGADHHLTVDPRMTLLDALRE